MMLKVPPVMRAGPLVLMRWISGRDGAERVQDCTSGTKLADVRMLCTSLAPVSVEVVTTCTSEMPGSVSHSTYVDEVNFVLAGARFVHVGVSLAWLSFTRRPRGLSSQGLSTARDGDGQVPCMTGRRRRRRTLEDPSGLVARSWTEAKAPRRPGDPGPSEHVAPHLVVSTSGKQKGQNKEDAPETPSSHRAAVSCVGTHPSMATTYKGGSSSAVGPKPCRAPFPRAYGLGDHRRDHLFRDLDSPDATARVACRAPFTRSKNAKKDSKKLRRQQLGAERGGGK
eukprot:scaffold1102_cov256-Pinguiococcus_pyrenoidosus.AAC.42